MNHFVVPLAGPPRLAANGAIPVRTECRLDRPGTENNAKGKKPKARPLSLHSRQWAAPLLYGPITEPWVSSSAGALDFVVPLASGPTRVRRADSVIGLPAAPLAASADTIGAMGSLVTTALKRGSAALAREVAEDPDRLAAAVSKVRKKFFAKNVQGVKNSKLALA